MNKDWEIGAVQLSFVPTAIDHRYIWYDILLHNFEKRNEMSIFQDAYLSDSL